MSNITILGSTGSIGISTLQVVDLHPGRYTVFALTAHRNVEKLLEQCRQYKPKYAVMQDHRAAEQLALRLKAVAAETEVLSGADALAQVASHPEVNDVMACIVGAAGLLPTLAAAKTGKRILLANKEALVMSGHLLMEAVSANGATLLPVDSEHNAIFQCLPADCKSGQAYPGVKRIILTASGGAFRDWPLEQLAQVTPEQACQHPNWVMGQKITVDSATMMNKGLEVIEAHWLFGMPLSQLEVILHPQSIIHSMVEYIDGSILAQLGQPDMRTPIAYALSWPQRIISGVQSLDLLKAGSLDFKTLCLQRYPCLQLAYSALKVAGTATTILNAANEVAVQAFLDRKIAFTAIASLIETVLSKITAQPATSLAVVLEADAEARVMMQELVCKSSLSV